MINKQTNKRMWLKIFKNVHLLAYHTSIQQTEKSDLISFPPEFLLKHSAFSHWLAWCCKPQPLLICDTYMFSCILLLTHPEKRGDCSICQKIWRTSTHGNTVFYKLKPYNQIQFTFWIHFYVLIPGYYFIIPQLQRQQMYITMATWIYKYCSAKEKFTRRKS